MRLRKNLGKAAARRASPKQSGPAKPGDLAPVFAALRGLLRRHQDELVPQTDLPDYFCLESKTPTYGNRPMYFAGVRRRKNYVSFYLMSVPVCPELVLKMSPGLKKRMQGKACFNFTEVDREIFPELARLTQAGFEKFKSLKYL